jgi:tRNA (guanine37-N1)-methyltransferase
VKIDILTIFPSIFTGFLTSSLIEKGIGKNLFSVKAHNIRDYASPPHHNVDDSPYGGGAGMVMMAEPLTKAIEAVKKSSPKTYTILLSPSGKKFTQADASRLSKLPEITFVCGRYEGVDQRFIDAQVNEELSIGDYVLMGGEVASMVIIEAVTRLLPGVLGNNESTESESFSLQGSDGSQLLESPHYTRPEEFKGQSVPKVLLSGDHKKIAAWRKEESMARTESRRPDLLKK